MALLEVKTSYATYTDCTLRVGQYQMDGSIAVEIFSRREELKILGYSDEQIQELRTPDFMGRVGFPAYALQNNNANIHRVEERVKSLKAVKEKGTKETEFELFKVVENVEAMRLQIIFDEKPEADVRAVLKKNGFKWAPSQGAWQRMLNPAGKYALNRVKEELEAV